MARALKVGLILRAAISVITVLLVPLGGFLLFAPDYWCGQISVNVVAYLFGIIGLTSTLNESISGIERVSSTGFLEVYSTTMLEGVILSFMLFVLSFIAVIFLQMKDRKKRIRRPAATYSPTEY